MLITREMMKSIGDSRQKGDVAEHCAKALLTFYGAEILQPVTDTGIDFCFRWNLGGPVFDAQVKYSAGTVAPFIYDKKWRSPNLIFVAMTHFDNEPETMSCYVSRLEDFGDESLTCLHHNRNGGASGPYQELRPSPKHAECRTKLRIENRVEFFRSLARPAI